MEEALRFRFRNLLDRDACPHGYDVGNVVFRNDELFIVVLLLFFLKGRDFRRYFLAGIAEGRAFFKVFASQGRFFFFIDVGQFLFQVLEFVRRRIDLHADAGRRFVHDVDGLVRQVAVGNVSRRQFDRSLYSFVGDAGLVEGFVAVAQAEEDSHGVVFRRFADQDGLEAAGQGGIFFKVFLIFVDSRGADALQIAAGQGRFEDVGRIHGAFDGTSPNELMDFVDEEDDRVVLFNRVEDALDPFFKFTTVLGTGNDTGQIEGENALVQQAVGHIASDDALGQTFGDGRLADARGADEDRIVLGPAAEDLDDAADFLFPADDRVDFPLFGPFIKVAAELGQVAAILGRYGIAAFDGRIVHKLAQALGDQVRVDVHIFQNLDGHAAPFFEDAGQHMFCADIVLFQPVGFADGQFHSPLRPRRQAQLRRRILAPADMLFDGTGNVFRRQAQLVEEQAGDAVCIENETEQDMFGPYVIMVEFLCHFLRILQDGFSVIGETIVHHGKSLPPVSNEYLLHGFSPLVFQLFPVPFGPGLELQISRFDDGHDGFISQRAFGDDPHVDAETQVAGQGQGFLVGQEPCPAEGAVSTQPFIF